MKRRTFLQSAQLGTIAAIAAIASGTRTRAQAATLTIDYLGHTCFRFSGGGLSVMANPFRPGGCTAGFPAPDARDVDITVVSSLLLDEGATDNVNEDRLLFESGVYQFGDTRFEGIPIPHDRFNGLRFGTNTIWKWNHVGMNVVHLGGGAAPLQFEQRALIGRPDLLLLPIGGGDKSYTPQEALVAMRALRPHIVIPTHYQTTAADAEACDAEPLSSFLELEELQAQREAGELTVRASSGTLTLTADAIGETPQIYLMTPQGLPSASRLRVLA
ncbi:MAG: MBL fold metallo-hydrolase [Geitlerinemataceae cyanobacterium]